MTTKWQVGKTYQLMYPLAFVEADIGNGKIHRKIGTSKFKVIDINSVGRVVQIAIDDDYFTSTNLGLTYFFIDEDIQYFKLVDNSPETKSSSPDEIVIEWLDKLYYVLSNDTNADTAVNAGHVSLRLSTDTVDICGSNDLCHFISTRYNQLHEVNRKELQSKREALLAELAEIDKQLGGE